jgi:hypothetical protein
MMTLPCSQRATVENRRQLAFGSSYEYRQLTWGAGHERTENVDRFSLGCRLCRASHFDLRGLSTVYTAEEQDPRAPGRQ